MKHFCMALMRIKAIEYVETDYFCPTCRMEMLALEYCEWTGSLMILPLKYNITPEWSGRYCVALQT
jgi:hypothetical protein